MRGIKEPHVRPRGKQQTDGVGGDKRVEANLHSGGTKAEKQPSDLCRAQETRVAAEQEDDGSADTSEREELANHQKGTLMEMRVTGAVLRTMKDAGR